MIKIYGVSMSALLDMGGDRVIFSHAMYAEDAESKTEFLKRATEYNMREHPPSEGWHDHHTGNTVCVPESVLLKVFADRLGMTVDELESAMEKLDELLGA